jgi:flagellar hook-basal body complex protein FliE
MSIPIGGLGPRPLAVSIPQIEGAPTRSASGAGATGGASATPFAERVTEAIAQVNASQRNAEQMSTAFAEGRQDDVHGTMIAMQEADIQLRFVANVRNRVLEAYREIMRMGA